MTSHKEEAPGASPEPPQLPQPPQPESQRDKNDEFWVELVAFTEQEHIGPKERDKLYSAYLRYQADLRALAGGNAREVQ